MNQSVTPSPCGARCNNCEYYLVDCHGCYATHGEPWWLTFTDLDKCEQYECCILSGHLKHCGECNMFPCDLYDEGDPVKTKEENDAIKKNRIETIEAWKLEDELKGLDSNEL